MQPANERGAGDKFFEILERKFFSKKLRKNLEITKKSVSLRSQNGRAVSPEVIKGKKFIENIEKTSSIINIHIYYKSVNSFINK